MKELPIGISDFRKIKEKGCIYVDKTKYVYEMIRNNEYVFLSRPRRFGKSLLVSVLECLFKGEKELFVDTWIYDKWNWESFPVVRLDMNNLDTSDVDELKKSLIRRLVEIAQDYEISLSAVYELVVKLSRRYDKKVVLLIDEYEKPILDHISDKDKAKDMREVLRQVYGRIKSMDENLRFVFLTG
ncbi:MAG: AAA family ATPase, partial [Fervidobacterium sp.]|nr:AAA family ATPase [Fervidobacterium sp.]